MANAATLQQICAQIGLQPERSEEDHADGRQSRCSRENIVQIHNRNLL